MSEISITVPCEVKENTMHLRTVLAEGSCPSGDQVLDVELSTAGSLLICQVGTRGVTGWSNYKIRAEDLIRVCVDHFEKSKAAKDCSVPASENSPIAETISENTGGSSEGSEAKGSACWVELDRWTYSLQTEGERELARIIGGSRTSSSWHLVKVEENGDIVSLPTQTSLLEAFRVVGEEHSNYEIAAAGLGGQD